MKVLSNLKFPKSDIQAVYVTNPVEAPKAKGFDCTIPGLKLPVTGATQTTALPLGTKRVRLLCPDANAYVMFGTGGVTANDVDSHFLYKNNQAYEYDVQNATHIAFLDQGGQLYVSCFG